MLYINDNSTCSLDGSIHFLGVWDQIGPRHNSLIDNNDCVHMTGVKVVFVCMTSIVIKCDVFALLSLLVVLCILKCPTIFINI